MKAFVEERSAGAVIYREDGGVKKYLILKYPAGHWDFPKGNIEKGEDEEKTVLREISEETGIEQVSIVKGFRKKIEYYYRRDGGLAHKIVIFHLVKTIESKVKLSYEHLDYTWLEYDDALKRVTYQNAKTILREAKNFLDQNDLKRVSKSLDEYSPP